MSVSRSLTYLAFLASGFFATGCSQPGAQEANPPIDPLSVCIDLDRPVNGYRLDGEPIITDSTELRHYYHVRTDGKPDGMIANITTRRMSPHKPTNDDMIAGSLTEIGGDTLNRDISFENWSTLDKSTSLVVDFKSSADSALQEKGAAVRYILNRMFIPDSP